MCAARTMSVVLFDPYSNTYQICSFVNYRLCQFSKFTSVCAGKVYCSSLYSRIHLCILVKRIAHVCRMYITIHIHLNHMAQDKNFKTYKAFGCLCSFPQCDVISGWWNAYMYVLVKCTPQGCLRNTSVCFCKVYITILLSHLDQFILTICKRYST